MTAFRTAPVAYQATVVAIGGKGIMIEGEPGIGKSALAHALIDRGAILVGDDSVLLDRRGDDLWASPHPKTHGLFEIRNVGIVTMPVMSARVAIALTLAEEAPRYVEQATTIFRAGCPVPSLTLFAHGTALPLRAEAALSLYGVA